MYKVVLPISGFENISNVEIEKIDEFFSFLKIDNETKLSLVNIKVLEKVAFNFEIDEKALAALKIKSKNDFDTYFVIVSQNPVEHSIINLVAPIFINENEKLVGQYITSEKVEPYLASLNKCAHL